MSRTVMLRIVGGVALAIAGLAATALLRNPALPPASAEALLAGLTDRELDLLRSEPTGPAQVRKIAQRILARRVGAV